MQWDIIGQSIVITKINFGMKSKVLNFGILRLLRTTTAGEKLLFALRPAKVLKSWLLKKT